MTKYKVILNHYLKYLGVVLVDKTRQNIIILKSFFGNVDIAVIPVELIEKGCCTAASHEKLNPLAPPVELRWKKAEMEDSKKRRPFSSVL